MNGQLNLDTLQGLIADGNIDTVLTCIVDIQGRLMGKRFHAEAFLEMAEDETHCCNYLLATDLEMATPDGFASTSWQQGYGDYVMKPDLTTLRLVPWIEGTAMVLCDVLDHHTHQPVPIAPRAVLQKQVARAEAMGLTPVMATELEFFLFNGTHDEITRNGFQNLQPISNYNQDYHIFQTSKEEHVMRPIRNKLREMGIPVEGTKGEAEAGQEELNIKYAEALLTADHHTLAKHAVKEIAHMNGHAATFLPKLAVNKVGSAAHVHQSMWREGENAFYDPARPLGKSRLMDHYMAGLIKYAADYTYFLAPYINSYKRFARGTFAPTQIVWSVDNRTAAYRLVADGTPGVRVECRTPGSDMNPYLAQAAQLAAGLKGIEDELELPEPFSGDAYSDDDEHHIPRNLRDARDAMIRSTMLREAFGDEVISHYARAAEWELEEFDRVVTDYEIARGFERA
ncbi:glutamine synthetase family protein [Pseudovibrio exalbescens]|uniref:Glutamine synthetase n=1 Tax=Pseudovibrio exalbescens TaxID=197461 RepID=A0A1U7JM16_9HYPH|nr:glutamine synthetase family protein [Pseudovibrio exalbescens]OKL45755.1 glutamine synthetase [Pseudovibrio exalbescens]